MGHFYTHLKITYVRFVTSGGPTIYVYRGYTHCYQWATPANPYITLPV